MSVFALLGRDNGETKSSWKGSERVVSLTAKGRACRRGCKTTLDAVRLESLNSGRCQFRRTETTFETPGVSMVIPYRVWAVSIVFLLWVIKMN